MQIDDWSTAMYSLQRTGAVKASLVPPLRIKWTYNIGRALWSHPVIVNHVMYLPGRHVYAINMPTGEMIWESDEITSLDTNSFSVWENKVFSYGYSGLYILKRNR
jgi:outer membrane protein assembly factor BamB